MCTESEIHETAWGLLSVQRSDDEFTVFWFFRKFAPACSFLVSIHFLALKRFSVTQTPGLGLPWGFETLAVWRRGDKKSPAASFRSLIHWVGWSLQDVTNDSTHRRAAEQQLLCSHVCVWGRGGIVASKCICSVKEASRQETLYTPFP